MQSPTLSNVSTYGAGVYSVVVSAANGCSNSATYSLQVYPSVPAFSYNPVNPAICFGDSVLVSSSIPITSPTLVFNPQTTQNAANAYPAPYSMYYGGQKMQFIDVPRDQGLKRRDRAVRLVGDHHQQLKVLIEEIRQARENRQPILLVAENDKESLELYTALKEIFPDGIQHIHSQTPAKEERERVKNAGFPGQITISTDMIGRGTDIALKNEAQIHGLKVLTTYLPSVRDLGQIVGRSGRFGANGDALMVLDKKRLKAALGKKTLTDGFYRNVETYIKREQAIMDRNKQSERLIKNTVGDFRKQITDNFFREMLKEIDVAQHKATVLPIWSAFFDKSDKEWNETWPYIQELLEKDEIDDKKINLLLKQYETKVQQAWDALCASIQSTDVVCLDGRKPIELLRKKTPELALDNTTKKLLNRFDVEQYSLRKDRVVYEQYERGHDGVAVTYKHWYILPLAMLKGYLNLLPGVHFENARPPFANFRAWLAGHGRLFPNLRAAIADLIDFFRGDKKKPETLEFNANKQHNGSYHLFSRHGMTQKSEPSTEKTVEDVKSSASLFDISSRQSKKSSDKYDKPGNSMKL